MSRVDPPPLGVSQLKPHRWIDSRPGAITTLTAAAVLTLLLAAAIARAACA